MQPEILIDYTEKIYAWSRCRTFSEDEAMGALFDLEAEGYFYTRLQNPTNDVVASKIADLEGVTAAMLTSSAPSHRTAASHISQCPISMRRSL